MRSQTFPECENLFTSMIDISKIADVVLLLIDESLGLEMETMEVITVIATHRSPSNISGTLTDLDLLKSQPVLWT
ncbi:hypothetical protein HOY80DRAFT_689905 [Tuber brumale]|nr:hypothetical protein HOY80DRAFT_689905 [Tuber brumale]